MEMNVLVSSDSKEFRTMGMVKYPPDEQPVYMHTLSVKLKGVTGRFVRVVAPTNGNGRWIFVDKVFINPEPGEGE
jgi:hypothetical protein